MRYFYVDYENTKDAGFKGVAYLQKKDKVCILYSKNANRIDLSLIRDFCEAEKRGAEFQFYEVTHLGHNALDFQLSAMLGHKIGKFQGKSLELYVVSRDRGFDSLLHALPELFPKEGCTLTAKRVEDLSFLEKEVKQENDKVVSIDDKKLSSERKQKTLILKQNSLKKELEKIGISMDERLLLISYIKQAAAQGTTINYFTHHYLTKVFPGKSHKKKRREIMEVAGETIGNLLLLYQTA